MEAEVVALLSCCRELFPIIKLVTEVRTAVGLAQGDKPKMHITIHKDNSRTLVLALTPPNKLLLGVNTMLSKLIGLTRGLQNTIS